MSSPLVRKILGESISDVLNYLSTIRPALDEAKTKAIASAVNEAQAEAIKRGHGHYVGSCGHTIQQCRCPRFEAYPHPRIEVAALCERCAAGGIREGKEVFASAPIKKVIEASRPVTYQVCPHCNKEIYERHTWIDGDFMSGEYVERHSDCGGAIERSEAKYDLAPEWQFLRDGAQATKARHQAYLTKLYGTAR